MIKDDVEIGEGTIIHHPDLVNFYGCKIGKNCKIGTFVNIEKGVIVGDNCKIQSNVFIPGGVILEDGVFVGPMVCFTNDKNPRAVGTDGQLLGPNDWVLSKTIVKKGASIGANSTIVCGVTIGENAMIGAGSVVTKDVPPNTTVYGNPARARNL